MPLPALPRAEINAPRRNALQSSALLTLGALLGPATLGVRTAHAQDLPSIVATARKSIVAIGSFDPMRNPQFSFRGTGFAISNGNTIVTCAHVLPDIDPATREQLAMAIPTKTGARVMALTLAASDRNTDLAVLRFDGPPVPALRLAEPGTAVEGGEILLIGFPIGGALGLFPTTHRGIVSAIAPMSIPGNRAGQLDAASVNRLRGKPIEILQLDATAYPGNSGSPLLDARSGRVLGVVSMVVIKGARETALTAPTGITYAVPIQHLQALVTR